MPGKHTNLIITAVAVLMACSAFAQGTHEEHMHSISKDVDALHDVLAPLWHAKAGKKRSQKVCGQVDQLANLARAIHAMDTKSLVESIAGLKVQCQATPTNIDAAFAELHEAFHHLAEPKQH
jgi:hypothetical protein